MPRQHWVPVESDLVRPVNVMGWWSIWKRKVLEENKERIERSDKKI